MHRHYAALRRSLTGKAVILVATISLVGCGKKVAPPLDRTINVRTQIVAIVARPRMAALTGEFRARYQSDLGFRIGGRIASRSVDVGDVVAAGDILATVDTQEQLADVTAAKAALRSAEASVQQASANVKRIEGLLSTQSASQVDFDDAKAVFLTAQGSVNISKSNLLAAESNLAFTAIKANSPGVIIARSAEVGQVVSAAQTVFTLAYEGEREAVFETFPTHINDKPIDGKIDITLVSNPAIKTVGYVREIAPSIDQTSGTVRVKVSIDSPPSQMTLGASVIGVAQFRSIDVVELPWTSLSRQNDQAAVWIVDPTTSAVSQRVVKVEGHISGVILISSGLEAGDIVVTDGSQLIRPGQKVKVIADAKATGPNQ